MSIALTIVHIACCLVLVLVVLLQTGKGADMGAVFGGSSQTLFGSSGAGNFLTRLTTGAAVVFMLTSLSLSYLSSASLRSSVFDAGAPEPPPAEAPAEVPPLSEAPAPEAAPPAEAPAAAVEIPAAPAPEAQAPAVPAAAEPQAAAPADAPAPATN
jgi:preprotein translocase subunit SecG